MNDEHEVQLASGSSAVRERQERLRMRLLERRRVLIAERAARAVDRFSRA